ncbi:MAG TPA: hypothetical protein VIE43_24980 [Thermoanaerobaculia bacterium]|jgi:hypothetical protein|nr:hypothetical protein [Thermoanaerobaculia bacterium]
MDIETDGRLRDALEPGPERVERIVRGALTRGRPARPRRLVPAAVGAAALLALALLFLGRPSPRASVSIENVGEVLIVRHPEGRVLIHNGEAAASSLPSGSMIVVHGGSR